VINRKPWRPLILTFVIALAGCATHAPDSNPADLAAITAFNARYLRAINTGDIATLSSLTDDDHIMLIPGRAPLQGKAANDAANGRYFEQFTVAERWNPVETVIDGKLAYQRGTITATARRFLAHDARHVQFGALTTAGRCGGRRAWLACSYAKAMPISFGSLNAVPTNDRPTGSP
jgi:ketosteroid isomerase-like protein